MATRGAEESSPRSPDESAPRRPRLETWSHAYYVQGASRLPQFERLWKLRPSGSSRGVDPPISFRDRPTAATSTSIGVRFDASQLTALKGEYRTWTRGENSVADHGGFFQVSFTF